jgi:hypothetical protein
MIPNLTFTIDSIEPMRFAASPHLACKLRIEADDRQSVHAVILKSQIQLDVTRRRYSESEQKALRDLFGEPERWGQTLRGLLWTHVSAVVPSFAGSVVVELAIPCSFDFNAGATKYFAGLESGDVPITLFFSGVIFYPGASGELQAAPITWDKEASWRLPVRAWREVIDAHYPNSAWLCLDRAVFERLNAFKTQHGIPTFEQALTRAMDAAKIGAP